MFPALMDTHRKEGGKKGSVATCVHDTTSGCSLFLFPFDVMVGLTYREELVKIRGCDGISTPSKEHWELLQKSGRLSVFSHKQISFHTTSSVGQCHNLALLLLILKKLLSSLLRFMPCICVFYALPDSDLESVGDVLPPQAILHFAKHSGTDKREKGHPGELPEAALRFHEPPENKVGIRIYFPRLMLVYHNVTTWKS